MAVSIASSAESGEQPARVVAPASEGQRAPGLIVQPVSLGEPRGTTRSVSAVRAQEQDTGKLGRCAARAPTRGWVATVLDRKVVLALMLVYLIASSVNELAPVASRAIRWASAWHKPVLSVITLACLAWTWRGQAQRLWASARALVHRQVLRPRPATL